MREGGMRGRAHRADHRDDDHLPHRLGHASGARRVVDAAALVALVALVLIACRRPSTGALPEGTYRCQTLVEGGRYEKSALDDFTLEGPRYATLRGEGSYALEGAHATFTGGPYDGWRAAIGRTDAGVYVRFRASSTGAPGDQTRAGDQLCFAAR